MIIHFENRAAAEANLISNGWKLIENGNWVSCDGLCAASIHPHAAIPVVQVAFWEIQPA